MRKICPARLVWTITANIGVKDSGFDPDLLHRARRRRAGCLAVVPDKAALAHATRPRQRTDGKIAGQMVRDPRMQPFKTRRAMLQGKRGAELCLAAPPLQEHDELARHREGELAAKVRL